MRAPLFGTETGRAVPVALPVPIDSLFDYALPEGRRESIEPGCRVWVRFAGQKLCGVVVERPEEGPDERAQSDSPGAGRASAGADPDRTLSRIERVLDETPVISRVLLEVLREAADEVLCPLGLALPLALPPGATPRTVRELALSARGADALGAGAVSGDARAVLEALARRPHTPAALTRAIHPPPAVLADLERDGLVLRRLADRGPAVQRVRARFARLADGIDLEDICEDALARAPRQAALLRKLAAAGEIRGDQLAPDERPHLRSLGKRGFVTLEEREIERDVLGPAVPRDEPVVLSDEQSAALVPIEAAIRAREARRFLLHGVTGSGKTEVYLRAIANALAAGRQALVLVPEITLTHQIVARLRARFGDELAILHSGLRPTERLEHWHRLRRGDTPIAVGARSALFAPLDDLGVIVIDEEHDTAYKNEEGFRYHARDLAARRAEAAGCPLILGSATPALESRYASEHGGMERLVLGRRIGGRPLPAVQLVDLVREKEKAPRGRKLILTRPLRRALHETYEAGGQSILFLNRRGFSTQVLCFECGHAERCPHCDVALVYHAAENRLRCHYCDHSIPPRDACAGCGAPDTALLGIGTERLEEEVRTVAPALRLARLDRDTASKRGHTESVLAGLAAGEIDVLIGTQMVAKGHDFPGVRLVGVVSADMGLHMPDFRAAERTFQLLTQVAGRAGRAGDPGRVIVQTFVPEHYALAPVATHDYETFYREELGHRESTGFPPFGALAQMMVSGPEEEETLRCAQHLAARLRDKALAKAAATAGPAPVQVLGPAPAALPRLRDKYRFQLLVKGSDRDLVQRSARYLAALAQRLPREVSAIVDVNPVHML